MLPTLTSDPDGPTCTPHTSTPSTGFTHTPHTPSHQLHPQQQRRTLGPLAGDSTAVERRGRVEPAAPSGRGAPSACPPGPRSSAGSSTHWWVRGPCGVGDGVQALLGWGRDVGGRGRGGSGTRLALPVGTRWHTGTTAA